MPLVICTVFFMIVFSVEYCWHLAGVAMEESALRRYESTEHPRRLTSDRYLDWLG